MTNGLEGIDHLVVLVRDLSAARHAFERLGFTLTDRAEHSAAMGTANTCLMFERDYVELLTVVQPTDANAPWRRRLEDGDGLSVVALSTGDAEECHRMLTEAGVKAEAPLQFSREVQLPDGVHVAKFSITRLPPAATPAVPMFACHHHTRELVWRPEWQSHENGTVGLGSVWAVVDRPGDLLAPYQTVFGDERACLENEHSLVVDPGGTPIRIVTPERFGAIYPDTDLRHTRSRPGLAGFSVWVTDIEHTRRLLTGRGIECHGDGDRSWAGAQDCCGTVIEFVQVP